MPEPDTFDAVIVGTGQGGKPLAGALAEAGWRVAVVERGRIGGTCVIEGCTPTKTMIASARVAHLARRAADYGVETGPVSVDLEVVRQRKRDIVDEFSTGSRKGLERHDTLELIEGEARFVAADELAVAGPDGERRVRAERIVLNVGARPAIPPIEGLDSVPYLDSTSVMELAEVPAHLLVLGGGFIGLEFAQMFRRFGSRVTMLEAGPRIASREDDDVSRALEEILAQDGIDVRTSTKVVAVAPAGDSGIELILEHDEGEATIQGSHLLVAVGRRPNSDLLDLARAGLETDDDGHIPVDDRCRTAVEGIWALGDVTGAPPFTHISYDDFRVVRSQFLGDESVTRAGRPVPYVVFTDPQLGRIGMTEREAREAGHEVRIATLPMSRVARAIETDETRGLMKAVIDAQTDRILGAAILGVEGGEVMSVLQVAMMGDLPYTVLRDAVLAHPTLAESLNNLFMTLSS
jgi:pyruvate/2-oxoglutarate dehydrogenase complex dihydrolipoamide dehydrogenase (E3) component